MVGISSCCERQRINFPKLTMTLSCTRTNCSSVKQERFRPGDFTVKAKAGDLNFVISLGTIDLRGASFLPKMVRGFRTVCVAQSPLS